MKERREMETIERKGKKKQNQNQKEKERKLWVNGEKSGKRPGKKK